jgi:hypothetical protein
MLLGPFADLINLVAFFRNSNLGGMIINIFVTSHSI